MYVIVDVDGTCANGAHRNHLLQQTPRRWDEWHEACSKDTPHEHIRALVWALAYYGHAITYITGRMERSRQQTSEWLRDNDFPSGRLFMRPEDDHRDDTVIKTEIVKQAGLTPENTLLVLEDRDRVVKMWRTLGFKCLQVAEGDF